MSEQINVMISSTSRDLPDYREQAMRACLQAGVMPDMMEDIPASDQDAIKISLGMVDKADIYVGLFAHRYGYVAAGHDRSITHMEYDRAIERGIPCLIFVMHEDVPVRPKDVDKGVAAEKLENLKEHLLQTHTVNFFHSHHDLRGQVSHSIKKQLDEWESQKSRTLDSPEEPVINREKKPENTLPPLPTDIELPVSPLQAAGVV